VGLLLMIRIVEFYRKSMQRRQVSCLDSYLDALQLQLWPRLRSVLDANIESLHTAAQQGEPVPANNLGHLVTRRYAELAASLHALCSADSGGLVDTLQHPLHLMQTEVCHLLESMATKLDGFDSGHIFLVNNYDLVLTIFHERHLQRNATTRFEELLRDQVHLFVESQLMRHFPDLVSFVKVTEPLVAAIDESSARAQGQQQGVPARVNVVKMEQVVRSFARGWRQETEKIHSFVMTSFHNFSNGNEILKQALTQLLLYYTRFHTIICKCFPQQPPFQSELVSKSTILMEIKQYSKGF